MRGQDRFIGLSKRYSWSNSTYRMTKNPTEALVIAAPYGAFTKLLFDRFLHSLKWIMASYVAGRYQNSWQLCL